VCDGAGDWLHDDEKILAANSFFSLISISPASVYTSEGGKARENTATCRLIQQRELNRNVDKVCSFLFA
jgi:hypothetical protein